MVNPNPISAAKGLGWDTFLMGFIPGLLQYRLGQKQLAGLAFLSCTAVFLAGWLVVGERLFYWALVESSLGFPVTFPELLNLPAHALGAALAWDGTPTGLRLQRMPRDFEHIAGWITGASGMLAAFWSAAGHWELRRRRDGGEAPPRAICNPAWCAAVSWLLPGLGHARAGQKGKGVLMGVAVLLVFVIGMVAAGGHAVDRADASVWWMAQNLFGGGSLFASLVTSPWQRLAEPMDLQMGVVITTVAGLMNLVVMVDAFTVAERSAFPLPVDQAGMPKNAAAEGDA